MSKLLAIVMAAGHGTRMKSKLPKVLHAACGRTLLEYPVLAALGAGAEEVVVVVNDETRSSIAQALRAAFGSDERIKTAVQATPRGTGDAAKVGLSALELRPDDRVLLLNGDVPLIESSRLRELVSVIRDERPLAFLSFLAPDPQGYGRVLRDEHHNVLEIREERDLRSADERAQNEVNGGLYAGRAEQVAQAAARLSPDNAQGEYYATDMIADVARSAEVVAVRVSEQEVSGVNDRAQLSRVEGLLFERTRLELGRSGVTIVGTPLIDVTVTVEPDARVEDGVRLRGQTRIGAGTVVDVGSVVSDCRIGESVWIKPYCVLTQSTVGDGVQLGPFAHLRPETVIEDEAHIGNFVETKKTVVRKGAKANHLAYLGDAEVGERSNLGAGTIICNYDGFRKQRTVIEEDCFIGSDSQLVAPVRVGKGAYVATGTTVTRDVPSDALAIGRTPQTNKQGYAPGLKARLLAAKREQEKAG